MSHPYNFPQYCKERPCRNRAVFEKRLCGRHAVKAGVVQDLGWFLMGGSGRLTKLHQEAEREGTPLIEGLDGTGHNEGMVRYYRVVKKVLRCAHPNAVYSHATSRYVPDAEICVPDAEICDACARTEAFERRSMVV